jgi:proliferating cell nuclear antigen PCNA
MVINSDQTSMSNRKRGKKNVEKMMPQNEIIDVPSCAQSLTFTEHVPDENHLLEMRTIQGGTFRNLVDTLKSVLNEANIMFNEKGLKLAVVDSKKHALVHLFIDASTFEFYHCKEKLVLGCDIDLLHKTLRTNKMNDLMSFTVHKDDKQTLEVSFENFQKGTKTSDKITLLTLPECKITDKIEYDLPPEIDSQSFQTICREMSSFHATKLEIMCTGDELVFSNLDGITKRRVSIKITNNGSSKNIEPARGVFLLKFLKSFAKASTLSSRVRIYLKNKNPLVCEYSVSQMGTLKYVLSPIDEDD